MVDKRKNADDGVDPPVKRQRVSRACDQCRAFREKCDGLKEPGCFTCLSSNRECTYTTPPKKRGIQPGYIRTLEITLAWLFENCPSAESTLATTSSQDQIAALVSGKDADRANQLYKTWRKSTSFKGLEKILGSSKLDHTYTPDQDSDENAQTSRNQGLLPRSAFTSSDSSEQFLATLPPNLWRILDVYFAYTHSWLPIIEKHDMLKLAYSYGDAGLKLAPGQMPEHAELWALLALAAYQDEVASSTPILARTSKQIYSTAKRLIPDENGQQSVSHVKALILLTLINIGSTNWTATWLLLGQAINIIIELGLLKASSSLNGRVHHTILACFLLDNLLCLHLKRDTRLSAIDVASLGFISEDGLEEWHPWTPCDGFSEASNTGSSSSSTRLPSHSISIFNQLVVYSRRSTDINVPAHLQPDEARATTPQMLHLHVLQSCSTGRLAPAIQGLLDFGQRFGVVAMSPIFRLYIETVTSPGISMLPQETRGALADILVSFNRIWGETASTSQISRFPDADAPPAQQMQIKHTRNASFAGSSTSELSNHRTLLLAHQGPASINIDDNSKPAPSTRTGPMGMHPYMLTSPDTGLRPQMRQNMTLATHADAFERYNSNNSIDVDALFDELASLDAESSDRQPLFMQNLGLAPGADLSDILGSDFGFDPLLSTYLHSAALGANSAGGFS